MRSYLVFVVVIVFLLISWSLVTFWQRFLENLAYNTLGINPESTWPNLLLAIFTTSLFLLVVWIFKMLFIPDLDYLIYDYAWEFEQDERSIGGPLSRVKGRSGYRGERIGRRLSPGGGVLSAIGD